MPRMFGLARHARVLHKSNRIKLLQEKKLFFTGAFVIVIVKTHLVSQDLCTNTNQLSVSEHNGSVVAYEQRESDRTLPW
jgi:hypothetical protein